MDVKRVLSLAQEIRCRYKTPLSGTAGTGKEIVLTLPEPSLVNATLTQEDIWEGERVKAYCIEGTIDGKWEPVQTQEPTISIGQKKIDKFTSPIRVSAIKLVISESVGEPLIQNFQAFKI